MREQPELFIEKRAAPRRQKMPTTSACLTSTCAVKPREISARCCGRPIYPMAIPPPYPTAELAPGGFEKDFIPDDDWGRRTT